MSNDCGSNREALFFEFGIFAHLSSAKLIGTKSIDQIGLERTSQDFVIIHPNLSDGLDPITSPSDLTGWLIFGCHSSSRKMKLVRFHT